MRRKLQDNLRSVRDRIAAACERAHRDPASVRLVAVTKSVGIDVIGALTELGVTDLGESRVQELTKRAEAMKETFNHGEVHSSAQRVDPLRWHMIGPLQRNKVKAVLPWTVLIHSLDRLRLAEEISKQAMRLGQRVDALLEVNGANEPQKSGAAVCAAPHLAEQIASMPNIRLRGLMTMTPRGAEKSTLRTTFVRVRELFEETRDAFAVGDAFDTFSAGMSGDFEVAIECGATMVRIGSALFEGIESYTQPRSLHASATRETETR